MLRGEIWLVTLDPTVGAEIGKTRPAVIISDDGIGILPLKVTVPITVWQDRYINRDWMVRIEPSAENNLTKTSAVDTFQVRSLSQERFLRQIGTLPETIMEEISAALAIVLNIN
ncbi:type II toxin-antitoxin system PemK/MazF family toxin [Floridanema aerugineum]|uniref:mRNA interferase n=1 Tax=Floridaenema aerugineum BLCC-F46 TaxID=3153654 RepID=A0ABV4X4E8_9CYAN